jgi:glycosyltransferase involved in cell wall biosynthesis
MIDTTPMIRPTWDYFDFHVEHWKSKNIEVVMCERDTLDVTRLCLESLLRFYPDIPILIVDGGSIDGSVEYVFYLMKTHKNVRIWERGGRNGHGTMLDEAISGYTDKKYILIMDNDCIIHRGGWIEDMLFKMQFSESGEKPIYALGSLMLVTYSNDGCGDPKDENDILRYTHPSCSMINRDVYLTLAPFVEHGAPLCYNMKDAQDKGLRIENYPIDKYVSHLSGASWTEPRTVWKDDNDVLIRPFFTFIADTTSSCKFLNTQIDKDFDVVFSGYHVQANIVIHFVGYFKPNNNIYPLRFRVQGEYICRLPADERDRGDLFLRGVWLKLISNNLPDELESEGLMFIKRKIWQSRESLS